MFKDRQAAAAARPCSGPDTLGGMETWQGFRLLPPPPPQTSSFRKADFPPDTEALAESNLKGFANTSMVLIETNIHQSAPRSESTGSGKDHVSPAGSDAVPRQRWQSRLAAGSLLPALSAPWGTRPGHRGTTPPVLGG